MRFKSLVFVLTAVSGIASAQPGPPPQPPPPPMDTNTGGTTDPGPPDTSNTQPVNNTPPPQTNTPPTQSVVEPAPEDNGDRPSGISIALGIGYSTPMDLQMPNISSARLRLQSGLTFEPVVRLESSSAEMDPPTGASTEDKTTRFTVGTLIRLPLVTHNKVDLEALGLASISNTKQNPEGDYNAITTTDFVLGYGVGVTYWISHHWNLSLSTTNALIDYARTKTQLGVPDMTNKTSQTTFGIVFSPNVFMMIHLYN